MRGVLYSVAMSLDGYIAGPEGDYDWIPDEPDIDRGRFLGRFDMVLTGCGTWEVVASEGGAGPTAGMRRIVFSRTLDPADHPEIEIVADDAAEGRPWRSSPASRPAGPWTSSPPSWHPSFERVPGLVVEVWSAAGPPREVPAVRCIGS